MLNFLKNESSASAESFSHLSGEETLETGAPYLRSCMDNLRTNWKLLSQTFAITGFGWWRWRPPLMLILLKNFQNQSILPPNLPPNNRLRIN